MPLFRGSFRTRTIYKPILGPVEMVRQLRALAALADELGLVPNTHRAHSHVTLAPVDLMWSSGLYGHSTHTYRQSIHKYGMRNRSL